MNATSLQPQIKSLQTQLTVLKAQVGATEKPGTPCLTFAELYGVLSGRVSSEDRDIEATEYQFQWEGKKDS
ncbi:MAG: hypothetical protein ABIH23_35675 [bacterium]